MLLNLRQILLSFSTEKKERNTFVTHIGHVISPSLLHSFRSSLSLRALKRHIGAMRNPIKNLTRDYSHLKVRSTLRRIRVCPDPWSTFFFLIWPFPWRYSLPYPLPSVEELERHPNLIDERQPGIRQLFNIPSTVSAIHHYARSTDSAMTSAPTTSS